MTAALVVVAALGWGLALALYLLLPKHWSRREIRLTHRLRTQVEPLLRRRAEELELIKLPPQSSSMDPDQVLDAISEVGQKIAACERQRDKLATEDTLNVNMADTQDLTEK